jgi:hypothetical protein
MAAADSPPVSDLEPDHELDRLFHDYSTKLPLWSEKDEQEAEWRFNAMNAPQLPEQPLEKGERDLADNIIKNAQGWNDALLKPHGPGERQFELDLAQEVSCLSWENLAKILPYVNKALEPSGLRIANIPGEKGDEIWLGRRDSRDEKYHIADMIGRRFDYCAPTS